MTIPHVQSAYECSCTGSAGVIGLQTALSLLRASFAVTVVAEFWPGDTDGRYTSPWYVEMMIFLVLLLSCCVRMGIVLHYTV